jgi:ribosome-associated heat shock protein Hsp15
MMGTRIDRWLFAARFFKTRSQAAAAVEAGHARVGGARVKSGRRVAVGDVLRITKGEIAWTIVVRGLSERRGPARVAATLYDETPESLLARELASQRRRTERLARPIVEGRPTKRERLAGLRISGKE